MKRAMAIGTALSLVLLALPHAAAAATWDGGNGNWNDAVNWDNDDVPDTAAETADTNTTTDNTITYPRSQNNFGANWTIGSLWVRSGDTLKWHGGGPSERHLTVNTTLSNAGTIQMHCQGNTNNRDHSLTFAGTDFTNTGTITLDSVDEYKGSHCQLKLTADGTTYVNQGIITALGHWSNNGSTQSYGAVRVQGAGSSFENQGTVTLKGEDTAPAGKTVGELTVSDGNYNQTAGTTTVGVDGETKARLSATAVNITGGTLQGAGLVQGPVTIASGATLGGGASIGTLTVEDGCDMQAGSFFDWEFDAVETDLVDLDGSALTAGAGVTVMTSGTGTPPSLVLFANVGSLTGDLSSWVVSGDLAGYTVDQEDRNVVLVAPAIIPEPVTLLAVFGGAGALAGYARRRRA